MGTAAYLTKVAVKSTSADPTGPDCLASVSECTLSETVDMVEGNYLGGDGFKRSIPTLRGATLALSGHFGSDAPQVALRTAFAAKSLVYITLVEDLDAESPANIGTQYPCYVESYEEGRSATDAITFSANLVVSGAPAVLEGSA